MKIEMVCKSSNIAIEENNKKVTKYQLNSK
jgi:hypothetical protein